MAHARGTREAGRASETSVAFWSFYICQWGNPGHFASLAFLARDRYRLATTENHVAPASWPVGSTSLLAATPMNPPEQRCDRPACPEGEKQWHTTHAWKRLRSRAIPLQDVETPGRDFGRAQPGPQGEQDRGKPLTRTRIPTARPLRPAVGSRPPVLESTPAPMRTAQPVPRRRDPLPPHAASRRPPPPPTIAAPP